MSKKTSNQKTYELTVLEECFEEDSIMVVQGGIKFCTNPTQDWIKNYGFDGIYLLHSNRLYFTSELKFQKILYDPKGVTIDYDNLTIK